MECVYTNAVYTCKLIVTSPKVLFIRNKVKVATLLLQLQSMKSFMSSSPHAREFRFWNPRNLCLWNPESGALKSGIQLKESRILLPIGIQNPRLSWISFYEHFTYLALLVEAFNSQTFFCISLQEKKKFQELKEGTGY